MSVKRVISQPKIPAMVRADHRDKSHLDVTHFTHYVHLHMEVEAKNFGGLGMQITRQARIYMVYGARGPETHTGTRKIGLKCRRELWFKATGLDK
jgi:hypothetical protein